MKKTLIIFLSCCLWTLVAQAQGQKISFSALSDQTPPAFSYDTPQQPNAYISSKPILLEIVVSDLSKLTGINIAGAGKPNFKLVTADISKFNNNGVIDITISGHQIVNAASSVKIGYPFTISMIYNGQTITSAAIGSKPVKAPNTQATSVSQAPAQEQDTTKVAPTPVAKANPTYTGSAFGDALTIQQLINSKDSAGVFTVVSFYYNVNITTLTQLQTVTANNAFLKAAFSGLTKTRFQQTAGQGQSGLASAVNSVGGIDVTNIANGMTEFMIKRAKEELTIAFFNKFSAFANKHPAFAELFPQTTKNLEHLLSYSYPSMLPALRSGFSSDLNAIPGNVGNVLADTSVQKFLQNYPEVSVAVQTIYLADQVASKDLSINDALIKMADFKEFSAAADGSELKNLGNAIGLISIVSNSLLAPAQTSNTGNWVTADDLKTMDANQGLMLYFGLLEQKINAAHISFTTKNGTIQIATSLDKLALTINKAQTIANDFLQVAATVDQLKGDIAYKKTNHIAITKDDVNNYLNEGLMIVDMGFDIAGQFDANIKPGAYEPVFKDGVAVYQNLSSADYPQAVLNAVDLLSVSIDLSGKASSLAVKKLQAVVDDINKYGLFIANMVNAKSGDDVESVIESTVLPVGSSSVKKNSSFNFAVQSYLGVHYLTGPPKLPVQSAWGDNFGVSAPIGLSVSYGLKKWGSVSLFGSLFDLGAIADYQLKTDSAAKTTTKDYQVKLGQIVSPGAFFVYGVGGNIPLSVGFGYQYGPGLGKINTDGTTVVNNPSGRWQVFLSVDIPLFNLVNQSYTGATTKTKSQ